MSLFGRAVDLRRRILRFNFYRCHLGFFLVTIFISSAIFYGSTAKPSVDTGDANTDTFHISYTDALFMCASAMTTTGLTSVNMSLLTGYQQSILFVLMWIGDLSTVSISVVFVRRWFFQKRMATLAATSRTAQKILENVDCEKAERQITTRSGSSLSLLGKGRTKDSRHPDSERARQSPSEPDSIGAAKPHPRSSSRDAKSKAQRRKLSGHERSYGGVSAPWEMAWLSRIPGRIFGHLDKPPRDQYLSFEPKLDDRGRFRRLTSSQYEELGGTEYRALQLLSWILPLYTGFWIFLAMIMLTPYAVHYSPVAETIRTAQPGDTPPSWWGVFTSLSAYTNGGLTLVNASMIPFQGNFFILLVTGVAILAGNTFYPIFLRCFIWTLYKLVPKTSDMRHSLSFLLHHPRRCYLFLFDRKTTWILAAVQVSVILGEWVLFEILNINQTAVWQIPCNVRVLDGLYQSLSTRSSGFYVVSIAGISPGMQVVYIATMFLSAFPIIISLRQTNVYEERSIGLDVDEYEKNSCKPDKKPRTARFTAQHVRKQLAYDLWWIILSWFLICIIEEPSLNTDEAGFDNFTILFEVVSGYGNCGLSLGVPYDDYSLVGQFHVLSKLIVISVMLRGRHRILPMAIDRSILLPGQGLMEEMDRDYNPSIEDEEKLIRQIRTAEARRDCGDGGTDQQDPEPEKERHEAEAQEREESRRDFEQRS